MPLNFSLCFSKINIILIFLIGFTSQLISSDLTAVVPITNQIIQLHFDDGYVEYHKGEDGSADRLFNNPLDTAAAEKIDAYTILSDDDAAYQNGAKPTKLGRKSKGADFTFNWPTYEYSQDHWIYLVLPTAMQSGQTYTIQVGTLAENVDEITLVFDKFNTRSETIHVNQIGFVPTARLKFAYLSHWMGSLGPLNLDAFAEKAFHLVYHSSNEIVFSGKINLRKDLETGKPDNFNSSIERNNYTQADVWECDFSVFSTPGEYRIVVEDIGCSHPFKIDENIYAHLFYLTARGLYHQRSGPARGEPYSQWPKPVDHTPGVNGHQTVYSQWRYMDGSDSDGMQNLPKMATEWSMPNNPAPWMGPDWGWGGYFDAGDWDRRTEHFRISQELLLVFELAPDKFYDGQLGIPESGNGIPDIIDEARWNIDFFRKMTGPSGGVCGGIEFKTPVYGTGSWSDQYKTWYAYAEEPRATFLTAAACAQLAYCLEIAGNTVEKDTLLQQAKAYYAWATNPVNLKSGDAGAVRDDRILAAAWLFKVTGDSSFQQQYEKDNRVTRNDSRLEDWDQNGYHQHYAVWTYVTTEQPNINQKLKETQTKAVINWAKTMGTEPAENRTCRMAWDMWAPTIVGTIVTTPIVMPLIVAHALTDDPQYADYIFTSCDYVLGGNALNMTWITGAAAYGAECCPSQIMCHDTWADGIEPLIPGIVPYGPIAPGFVTWGGEGPWGMLFNYQTLDPPDFWNWPTHELYFSDRYFPMQAEYTVQQTIGPSAAAYAYLFALSGQGRPTSVNSEKKTSKVTRGAAFKLFQNQPNPFNSFTRICFHLPQPHSTSEVSLKIFNLNGQFVREFLMPCHHDQEHYEIVWNGTDNNGFPVPSGLYFYQLKSKAQVATRSMILLK